MLNTQVIIRIHQVEPTALRQTTTWHTLRSHFADDSMSLHKKDCRHDGPMLTTAASILLGSILLICGPFAAVAGSSNQPLDNQSIVDLAPGGIGRDISAGEIQWF